MFVCFSEYRSMLKIKRFVCNSFQVNTYVLSDETGECLIVDPGCYFEQERKALSDYIMQNQLKPVRLVNTHAHVDHILGNNYVSSLYKIYPEMHKSGLLFLDSAIDQAWGFGFELESIVYPRKYLVDGEMVQFGHSELQAVYTPGHADGSMCFISHAERFVITGDVLFLGSIGRTDLPTGNFDVLIDNIQKKLCVLPDDYVVYPGHGPDTTIGVEKDSNPFL